MTFEYALSKDEYLSYYLFAFDLAKKRPRPYGGMRTWSALVYIAISLYFLYQQSYPTAAILLVAALLWYMFYPHIDRRRYLSGFRRFLDKNISERYNNPLTLTLDEKHVSTTAAWGESSTPINEITEVFEVDNFFYIINEENSALVVPKNAVPNLDEYRAIITAWAAKNKQLSFEVVEW